MTRWAVIVSRRDTDLSVVHGPYQRQTTAEAEAEKIARFLVSCGRLEWRVVVGEVEPGPIKLGMYGSGKHAVRS